jgi:hypothetical protein
MSQTAGEVALGLEGLALLRMGSDASDDALRRRVSELVGITKLLDLSLEPIREAPRILGGLGV